MNLEFELNDLKDINIRYWLYTRQPILLAVGGVVIALLVIVLAIVPQIQEMFSIQQDIVAEQRKVVSLQQKILALEQAATLPIVDKSDQINDLLPSKKPLLEILTSLNTAAADAQVTFTNIEVAPGTISTGSAEVQQAAPAARRSTQTTTSEASRSNKLDLRVTVEGDLGQINQFLETIELAAPFSNVTGISLNERRRNDTNQRPFEAELVLTTYYFTQPIVAAVEAPLPELDADEEAFIGQIDTFQFSTEVQSNVIRGGGLDDLFGVEGFGVDTE
jgi:hypothetical protein